MNHFKGKILAVDDTPASLRLLTDILKTAGYEVISAINGEIALQAARAYPTALVLLDICMPGMDGFEVCRRLKADPQTSQIPVIFLSAVAEIDEKVKGFDLGAVDFVSKPYQRSELLVRVRTHLELSQLRHQLSELVAARTSDLVSSQGALKTSQAKLALCIEHAPVAIAMFDVDMRYLAVSRRWIHDFIPQCTEVIGQLHYDLLPEGVAKWKAAHQRGLQGEVVECDEDYFYFNGEERYLRWAVHPWFTEGHSVGGITIFCEDITQRKMSELELRKLSQVIEQSPESIVITDLQAQIHYVNDAFVHNSGFTATELLGSPISLLKSGKTPAAVYQELWAHLHRGAVWKGEFINKRKNGDEYISASIVIPIKNPQGLTTHFAAIQEDISEKTLLTHELENYRTHLEALVAQRTAELDIAKTDAESANQAKSEFLSNMSHEIRTPMNAVLGFCYMLEQQNLTLESRDLVHKIHNAGKVLLSIINDILDFSKIEAGRLELETQSFRLSTILDNIASLMSASARNKQLELIINPPLKDYQLLGDELRLHQVLVNLVSNAIKFTEQGEVALSLSITAEQEDRVALYCSVRDTGIGISPAQQHAIFAAFAQGDCSISRRYGGTGLGLAISHRLVELMGGQLQLHSTPQVGSEFSFTLPLRHGGTSVPIVAEMQNLQLLIVDDCDAARAALLQSTLSLGWNADLAECGESAVIRTLDRLSSPYDVLLIDWNMPVLNGLLTAQTIRQALANELTSSSKKLPIILMVTAFDQEELKTQPGIEHIDGLLPKPVTPSLLYDAVLKAIKHTRPAIEEASVVTTEASGNKVQGIRVLIVDDSEINLEVAQLILSAEGACVFLAHDGQEALEWLQQHPDGIDIVLMDVQMPRLDGYGATRQIRQHPQWQQLPILALTAGAFKNLQDAALDSGMNDFIAKPFDVEVLIEKIRYWTQASPIAAASKPVAPVVHAAELTQWPGINIQEGLKIWRNEEHYQTYLRKFIEQYRNVGAELTAFAERGEYQALAAYAHKLKGSSANLALQSVTAKSFAVEVALKDTTPLHRAIADLQYAMDEAALSLQNWLALAPETPAAMPDTPPIIASKAVIATLLKQLLTIVETDNPLPAQPILQQLLPLLGESTLAPIRSCLLDFDLQQAEILILQLQADLQLTSGDEIV